MTKINLFFAQHRRVWAGVLTVLVVVGFGSGLAGLSLVSAISYSAATVMGAVPLVLKAVRALSLRTVSIELLVSIAVVGALAIGEYSEAGIVTWLFLLGEVIEEATLKKTRSAIKDLTELAPQTAQLLDSVDSRDAQEVDIDEIDEGDLLLVTAGAQVPVDGNIVSGRGHFDEASITGEPLPRAKNTGDEVFAGTHLHDGTVVVQAASVGEDTVFGKILELVEEAEDSKTSTQRFIDRFATFYTPAVLVIALVVGLITRDVRLAITVLVLGCPGALVIGVPVSNVAGIGAGAKAGVLAKGAQVLEELSSVDTIVMDKTGTLTLGQPKVIKKLALGDEHSTATDSTETNGPHDFNSRTSLSEKELWRLIASAEHESTHPLATAIVAYAQQNFGFSPSDFLASQESQTLAGRGLKAQIERHDILIGNAALLADSGVSISRENTEALAAWSTQGLSSVLIAIDSHAVYALGIGDDIRSSAPAALKKLRELGVKHLIMASGDEQSAADVIAARLGLDEAHGGLLPQDKAELITSLQAQGRKVAFVGDGINDSPALVAADAGIAMGGGTATAIDIADVVLLHSDIARLPAAFSIARATRANTRENIFIAVATVVALFIGLMTGFIYMASGMLVHEASILVVVLNAVRLLHRKLDVRQVKTEMEIVA